ncbi:MAG: hypothetical protein HC869_23680 [Rhodospirillales bacterium]|nr:hypothetical protein [Rhodospirillales bacterium]
MAELRMYSELAHWWPLLSPPSHYVEEAVFFRALLWRARARAGCSSSAAAAEASPRT